MLVREAERLRPAGLHEGQRLQRLERGAREGDAIAGRRPGDELPCASATAMRAEVHALERAAAQQFDQRDERGHSLLSPG